MDKKCKCDKCGCEEVAITVQYRKSSVLRALNFLLFITIFLILIFNTAEIIQCNNSNTTSIEQNATAIMSEAIDGGVIDNKTNESIVITAKINPAEPLFFICTFALCICKITQYWIESKVRVYYVCKNCGKTWYDEENFKEIMF